MNHNVNDKLECGYTIKQLPADERPRERFLRYGDGVLSAAELLAIILSSGIKGKTVLHLSQEIISHFGSLKALAAASVDELRQIKGLGYTKALKLKAAFSLGLKAARQQEVPAYCIRIPLHVYNLIKDDLADQKREHFIVLLLNTKNFLIRTEVISIGTLTNVLVHPREVFYPAVRHNAASLILVHNHPSGDPSPSPQDYSLTEQLIASSKVMGIPINDHIIVGKESYVSLREKGINF